MSLAGGDDENAAPLNTDTGNAKGRATLPPAAPPVAADGRTIVGRRKVLRTTYNDKVQQ
jgi:hypothetical protein